MDDPFWEQLLGREDDDLLQGDDTFTEELLKRGDFDDELFDEKLLTNDDDDDEDEASFIFDGFHFSSICVC